MYTLNVRSRSGTVHEFSYESKETYDRMRRIAIRSNNLTIIEDDVETEETDGD